MQNQTVITPREIILTCKKVYVVGDIHACPKELEALLTQLIQDGFSSQDQLIFIGDYINKGLNSLEVLNFLIDLKTKFPETIFLKGNHEDMFLGYLGFPSSYGDVFLRNGGEKTLKSYSIAPKLSVEETKSLLPKAHLDFLLSLTDMLVSEEYIFVHAGVSPIKEINSQLNTEIFWIRNEFIQNIHKFNKTVIFGHTPFKDIWLDLPYKIGLDTGLVYKNMLSCIELKEKCVFQVKYNSTKVTKKPW